MAAGNRLTVGELAAAAQSEHAAEQLGTVISWQPQVRNTDRCNPCRACPVGIEWVTTVSAGLAGSAFRVRPRRA